ncbi:MAG: TldD/PmbA family protein [Thermoanaerobaculia bacterium]|nr:TldD/PmbA family protein [Thermoanaerobaculia bacterium]
MSSPRDGLLERILAGARCDAAAGESAEAYERRGTSIELAEDAEGTRLSVVAERGFALRLFRSGRTAFAASPPEASERLPAEARLVLGRARARRGARATGPVAPGPASALAPPPPPDEASARALLASFRSALLAEGEGAVSLTEAILTVGARTERVATTAGRDVAFGSGIATLVATVTGRTAAGSVSARVLASASRPGELFLDRLAHHAVDRVLLPLRGRPLAPARGDLLLDPNVAATVVGRLASAFFGDEGNALLASRTRDGRDAFASPLFSLVDDSTVPGGPVKATHDGEGTPHSRTVLVSRGIAAGKLSDSAAAVRLERPPTGNALRRAYTEPPAIGITNLFVDSSAGVPPLDLLRALARGFYAAVLLSRPEVDLPGDRFRLHAAGYWIEKGRAREAVSETLVEGRLSEFLRSISAVGDDLRFVPSGTGSAGAPTLFVPKWKGA